MSGSGQLWERRWAEEEGERAGLTAATTPGARAGAHVDGRRRIFGTRTVVTSCFAYGQSTGRWLPYEPIQYTLLACAYETSRR
jgi:hypothetical protein